MTLRKVKGNFERLFDKNLTDLVRGIRNHKEDEAKYISQCVEEIKEELRLENANVKATAVAKLTYLQMLGYDVSWAAFNIIEVMSSTKFTLKRMGYLSASQCFHENTDVMMLTTNMIRKDLNSQNMYDAGCAMSGLSCFVSADNSRDLVNDVMTLMTSTKPYLRKKAILLLYKIFLKFPEALKPAFPRLKEKLEDPDPGVQSAAVNVICELARKNPKNYLSLAPVFFKLMNSSTNNWMLIKIIKLFGALTPLEPRLGKKLIEPLTNLIHSTSAMSLLYECINTVIAVLISISSGLPNHNASIQLCVQKLRILIEDSDQNLKYLGLLAMSKILKTHPKSVQAHKDLVLACLDDKDESIRLRALDLLYGMVSKKNVEKIVEKLMLNVSNNTLGNKYRDELIFKIVDICAQSDYQHITDFEWYISVLVDLARVEGGTEHGQLVAHQMLDVAIRVEAIRPYATKQMADLLASCSMFANNTSVCEVLYAAAWICGEFSEHLEEPSTTLLNMLPVTSFPVHIEAIFIQNASKIFARLAAAPADDFDELCESVKSNLTRFLSQDDLEVQERAMNLTQLIDSLPDLEGTAFETLYHAYALNPVAPQAQKKVTVPSGLDLDEPFLVEVEDEPAEELSPDREESEEEQDFTETKKAREANEKSNIYYLKGSNAVVPEAETDEPPKRTIVTTHIDEPEGGEDYEEEKENDLDDHELISDDFYEQPTRGQKGKREEISPYYLKDKSAPTDRENMHDEPLNVPEKETKTKIKKSKKKTTTSAGETKDKKKKRKVKKVEEPDDTLIEM
ncbi:AP-3 complex subunit delta-1 [Halotydeus destructor]|nr:AP-3 complex subunit delta-1 [Halotydeus destructor]